MIIRIILTWCLSIELIQAASVSDGDIYRNAVSMF